MKNLIILSFLSVFTIGTTQAQQDFLMYNMYEVPQSIYSNPSNQFNGQFYLGLPFLSSNYYSISNSGFAYSDGIRQDGDSLLLDLGSLISELEDENFTSFNARIDLFGLGIHLGKRTQLTLNVTENAIFKFNYPKDFVRFVYEGNGAFEDDVANFENLGLGLFYYREFGVGLSHQLTHKLRLGVRAKYLYGIANIYSEKTDLRLRTDPETFALTGNADIVIRTSGINSLEGSEVVSGLNNRGLGLDLGGHYELNERISFNASVLDLGSISWKDNIENHVIEEGEYTYSGIALDVFAPQDGDTTGETSFDRVLDSLEQAFDINENEDEYSTPLVPRIYIGANYKFNEKTVFGGLIQSEFFQGNVRPSFTVSANRKMTKWITLAASFTAINRSYNNLGFGFSINPGPVQLYVMSDNILSAFQPQHARHAQVRFGINLIFGSKKTPELHAPFKEGLEKKKQKEGDDE